MTLLSALRARFDPATVSLELGDIQAIVLRERPEPYVGTHLFLRIDQQQAGRELVRRLVPHVTSATAWATAEDATVSVALGYGGLVALGVPEPSLASFPETYRQGMAARASLLLDEGANAPERWQKPFGTGEAHVVVSIYASDEGDWQETRERARQQYGDLDGITVLDEADFGAQPGSLNPFGFRDLIGQPAIEGSGVEPLPGQGRAIKAGEFILGYPGESGAPLPMPAPEALGRNGTFMGIRKYQSLVGTFNRFLRTQADSDADRERLAAKLFGRWRSGTPLTVAPDGDDPKLGADPERNNDFLYADDPDGKQVPLGAHMRRMNPRDTAMPLLTDVNLHRIVRRSTTFGPPYRVDALSTEDDEVERGLFFIFLSARAMETMEFLQREWINDGNSMNLGDERDPIVGLQTEDATFTIPRTPVRHRLHGVETFNVLRGGEYLFVPSLSALRWLSALNT